MRPGAGLRRPGLDARRGAQPRHRLHAEGELNRQDGRRQHLRRALPVRPDPGVRLHRRRDGRQGRALHLLPRPGTSPCSGCPAWSTGTPTSSRAPRSWPRPTCCGAMPFEPVNAGEDTRLVRRCKEEGIRIYSADRFNFIYIRGGRRQGAHLAGRRTTSSPRNAQFCFAGNPEAPRAHLSARRSPGPGADPARAVRHGHASGRSVNGGVPGPPAHGPPAGHDPSYGRVPGAVPWPRPGARPTEPCPGVSRRGATDVSPPSTRGVVLNDGPAGGRAGVSSTASAGRDPGPHACPPAGGHARRGGGHAPDPGVRPRPGCDPRHRRTGPPDGRLPTTRAGPPASAHGNPGRPAPTARRAGPPHCTVSDAPATGPSH